ncbi:MAG: glucosylceramidase [Methylomonas sp.]|nr:glucosylceramidase [Methylomonas sp.]PPD20407.1 MAG: glucosylceramidase [Methylomonas sp.]PPD25672.1 MAG: glucosylceramidase [Methylomonas sp.]PPD36649.1 MAG: glucosylceramidase [Methylomonas sp.]PPD40558.1 MAG: glucosylceramidase [Methylomonas sp.]
MQSSAQPLVNRAIEVWLTSADQHWLLQRQADMPALADTAAGGSVIHIDDNQLFQPIEGFGFSLTGGSALLIRRLPQDQRLALLHELFSLDGDGIGVSVLRLTIGASDLSERSFSYDDLPAGASDVSLAHFDLAAGDADVIPTVLEILAINPTIRIIAAPWSAPVWMKTNSSFVGGELRPACYPVYARYLATYLKAMRAHGIVVHAITPQNEPLNHKNDPSMVMPAAAQAEFIGQHLGPVLHDAGLGDVAILCWDHNCDVIDYSLTVLADVDAHRYVSGSAWHLYGGDIAALSEVHRAYPDKKIYFTEQWVGSDGEFGGDLMWHVRHVLIGALRNWSRIVLEWNLAADPGCCPHTPGGEARCVGALTIDGGPVNGNQVSRNVAYYIIAHAARWLRPGSVRIASSDDALPNVACMTADGSIVVIVLNDGDLAQIARIRHRHSEAVVHLPPRSVATCILAGSPGAERTLPA